jgi:hypothetical protein
MSTNEHAQYAQDILSESTIEDLDVGDLSLSEALAYAQVNATLALAHEQRVANQIAAVAAGHWLGFDQDREAWDFLADRVAPTDAEVTP